MNKTLILGVGNPLLGDDGVGIHVINKLKEDRSLDADFEEVSVSGLELVELFKGYQRVLIVDAMKTKQGTPGQLYELTPEDIPTLHGITPHDVDFKTALRFGEKFIGNMPKDIQIYAIEAESIDEFTEELSPRVKKSIPRVVERIKEVVQNGKGS